MENYVLKNEETLDDLLIQGLKIIQKKRGFRFTLDSITLAQFVTLRKGDKVIDLGTGNGIIPLILSSRRKDINIIGVEIQEEIAEMACRSIELNRLDKMIEIITGDLRDIHKKIGGGIYTAVTANPPYWTVSSGCISNVDCRAKSRHEIEAKLEDFIKNGANLLNYQGRFAMVYDADRLVDLFSLLRSYKLEPRRVRFIHSFLNREAKQVLVEARKGAASDLKVLPPLVIYEKLGLYSKEILDWYKGGDSTDG